jgi:hypothetical protein
MKSRTFVKGEKPTLSYQLKEGGSAKDITGMSFKIGVKEKLNDTSYKIGPVTGDIDDATSGKFSFTFTVPEETFKGLYEVAMYDASSNKTVLTSPRGVEFRVVESIVDA